MSAAGDTPRGPGTPPADEGGLEQLRNRLDALQNSVERLGTEQWTPPPQAATAPQPPMPQAPADPYASPYAAPAPPAPDPPPPAAYASPYEQAPVPAPPAPDPAYAPPPLEPPLPYAPPPAAINGHSDEAPVTASIALVNAGPFANLIELRHFEEAVVALAAVSEVHVRRYGHGRAEIEVGLAGPYLLADELHRLGRPMRIEPGPDGELMVIFTDIEIESQADQPEEAAARASSDEAETEGEGGG